MGQLWAKNENISIQARISLSRRRLLHHGEATCLHLILLSFVVVKGVFIVVDLFVAAT